ncbi:sensor histidine kinase [Pseudactinotalea sp. HY158]|uniref:sensor histidine kinase n=1 Tax=Pseudactinotalea sp. HY158 TaxID=2654547 RepID=UPI00129D1DA4|nr:sensor histidine kinase [Pseudactinotalea sp. HY158]QGH69703.1 sensor histidine kinase [Pseudactinotalea sp. HY158]
MPARSPTGAPSPTDAPPIVPVVTRRRAPQRLWSAPFTSRAWRDLGTELLILLTAPFGFAYAVLCACLTAALAPTVAGLYLPGWLVLGARGWGGMFRGYARLLGTEIAHPLPRRRGHGFWRGLANTIGDGAGWRAVLFLVIALPLAIVSAVLVLVFLVVAAGLLTYWFWYRFLPAQQAADGTWHRGSLWWDGTPMDTTSSFIACGVAGIVLWFLWPQLARGFAAAWAGLAAVLLGPTRSSLRVAALESSRGRTVADADTKLRWIERDLHDGTQARLVALAMQLGEATELLESDPAQGRDLVAEAHAATKDTLVELRELARGIRPPALEAGLAVAVETLSSRSPLPVTVDIAPDLRPDPPIESIAYFAIAELITNAVKHARASGVYVLAEQRDQTLWLRVRDDGIGGAEPAPPRADGHGTGLAGLRDRVASVDGGLRIESPAGEPTVVTITLPMRVAGR